MDNLSIEEIDWLLWLCNEYIDNGVGWENKDEEKVKIIMEKLVNRKDWV